VFTSGTAQTLPIWIFSSLARPDEQPVVNVVALFVIVVSIIPVYIATRLAGSSGITSERPKRSTVAANIPEP
jgi:putative spermidine/putrescine transport system permease protein